MAKKRAIVLAGGGARGPYQIGVWQALREMEITYDIVTGSSVGALNGALMVQGDYEAARRMWEHITTRDIIKLPALEGLTPREQREYLTAFLQDTVTRRALDVTPLEALIRQAVNEEQLRQSPVEFGLVTTRLPLLQRIQLRKEEIPQGELVDFLMASASYFPFFGSREIDGSRYVDGAYADNMPVKLAIACGAEEIIAVDLDGLGIVQDHKGEVPVTHIYSHWDLGQILFFDPGRAKTNMQLGYQDGLKAFRKLEGQAYAFRLGETAHNALALHDAFLLIRHKTGLDFLADKRQISEIGKSRRHRHGRYRDNAPRQGAGYGRAVTGMAEIAGMVLGIAPDRIYTLPAFNSACLQAFYRGNTNGTAELPVMRILHHTLERAVRVGKPLESLRHLESLAPRAFLAAGYLVALELAGTGVLEEEKL